MDNFEHDVKEKFGLKGIMKHLGRKVNGDIKYVETVKNKVVDIGLNDILGVRFNGVTARPLYFFIVTAATTPLAGDTLTALLARAPECVGYSESARQPFTVTVTGPQAGNASNKAIITFNEPVAVYGAGTCTSAVKGSNSADLFSYVNFTGVKNFAAGETLELQYTLVLSSL